MYSLICCWFLPVCISFHIQYSSVPVAFKKKFFFFCLFMDVLTELGHLSPEFSEHLWDYYFEVFIWKISISSSSFAEVFVFFFHAEGQKVFFHLFTLPKSICLFLCIRYNSYISRIWKNSLTYKMSCGAERHSPLWSPVRCSRTISCVGHMCPPIVTGLWWLRFPRVWVDSLDRAALEGCWGSLLCRMGREVLYSRQRGQVLWGVLGKGCMVLARLTQNNRSTRPAR